MIISLLTIDHTQQKILKSYYNESVMPFFGSKSVKEIINFLAKEVSKNSKANNFHILPHDFDNGKTFTCYCLRNEINTVLKVDKDKIDFKNDQESNKSAFKSNLDGVTMYIDNILVVDGFYPNHVAYYLLKEMARKQLGHEAIDLKAMAEDYEDYASKDDFAIVFMQLDETTVFLKEAMEQVIGRGRQLDDMILKSEELSTHSKKLFQMSKSTNSCFNCSR